ncbi:MAG: hypothetical protein HY754_16200, partial [Nitrospirae bacterium]|nr:hypothetical protein [Nitrospirota bacterium]
MLFKNIKIITVINGIAALIVLGMLLFLIRGIVSSTLTASKKSMPGSSDSKQQKDIHGKKLLDYSPILKKNPFGFYAGELSVLSSKSEGSSIAADISLVGTISGNKRFAYAIFADRSNVQEIFKIGDSVFGLGRLQKVEKDSVVINDNGKTKEIKIADIVTVRETTLPETKTNKVLSDSFTGEKFARKMAETSYMVDGQRVQQAIANPNQIMTDARLLPNVVEGKQDGFMLKEVRPGGIYQSLGLQNGDVLLRINEYNISNP